MLYTLQAHTKEGTNEHDKKEQQSPWQQVLTPEDGQIGPKHVV
jgi:hypothetical protein